MLYCENAKIILLHVINYLRRRGHRKILSKVSIGILTGLTDQENTWVTILQIYCPFEENYT